MNGTLDRWVLVEKLRHPLSLARKSSDAGLTGVNVSRTESWDLYLGTLIAEVSEQQIVDFVKAKGTALLKCFVLLSRVRNTKSARISLPLANKDKLLDPAFWPQNVRVRSWIIRPRWASKAPPSGSIVSQSSNVVFASTGSGNHQDLDVQ